MLLTLARFWLQVGAFPPAVMHRSEYPEAKVKKLYMQALRLVRSPHDRPFAVQISWRQIPRLFCSHRLLPSAEASLFWHD